MRQSIGGWFTLNIIIIFIVIVFGLLSATISYYKAFKLNSMILDTIEKYEGYNEFAKNEIENNLNAMGYVKNNGAFECPTIKINKENKNAVNSSVDDDNTNQGTSHYYCVYYQNNDGSSNNKVSDNGKTDSEKYNLDGKPIYYNYVVVTYIFVDLPIVGQFKVPVRTKGERSYHFSEKNGNPRIK